MNKNSNWLNAADAIPQDLQDRARFFQIKPALEIACFEFQKARFLQPSANSCFVDFLATVSSECSEVAELGGGHLGCGGLHLGSRRLVDARQRWATGDIAGTADWCNAHGLGVIAVVVNAGGLAAVITGQGVGLGDIAAPLGFCDNGNSLLCLFGLDVSARKTKLGRGSTGPVAIRAAANADVFHGSSLHMGCWSTFKADKLRPDFVPVIRAQIPAAQLAFKGGLYLYTLGWIDLAVAVHALVQNRLIDARFECQALTFVGGNWFSHVAYGSDSLNRLQAFR